MERTIFIPGNVPSLKNSKQWIPKIKKLIPSKTVQKYLEHYEKYWSTERQNFLEKIKGLEKPYKVGFYFMRKTRHKFDWINAVQICQDLMVKHKWIEDDDCDNILPFPVHPGHIGGYCYNKENPGVIIAIIIGIEKINQ